MAEEEKRGPGRPPKQKTVAVEVMRDFWPTENQMDRVRKGTIIDLDPMEAIDLIEQGRVRRVK